MSESEGPLTDQEQQRRATLERLRAAGIEPYPARSQRTHTTTQAIALLEQGQAPPAITVAGRLVSIRIMGKGSFVHIEDGDGRIQLYLRQDRLGEESYEMFKRDLDLGDFVEARGGLFYTRTHEPSVQVEELRLLAKALRPLPIAKEKDGQVFDAFADKEQRYRQRYVDLAVNPDVRDLFRLRARLVSAIRRFLDARGFLEVETPILQPLYGGAAARPFVTFHNQLKQDLFLRIADELYLKRLIVGGFERVYEIGRDFRNEGVSFKHNPEFTQIEFYAAYADYENVMEITEQMVAYAAQEALGSTRFTRDGHEIDLSPPWRRWRLRDAIRETTGIDYDEHPDAESLYQAIVRMGGTPERKSSWGKLVDPTLINYVEPYLVQPTFLYDYPLEVSPLAKKKEGEPGIVERFEFFIGGVELGNAFSEINDPLDQRERFLATSRALAEGDEEAHPLDEDYIAALSYGMPPTGGFGMGIDRLTMLLSGKESLREVILFPHLRPRD
ncbi:MAG TPA: lysine--tRNA ligase [Anaerolineae bacterium]|nr:lysine--tRNA ligase [Anaerolineae bacterium]